MRLGLKQAVNLASMLQCMLSHDVQPWTLYRGGSNADWGAAYTPTPGLPALCPSLTHQATLSAKILLTHLVP